MSVKIKDLPYLDRPSERLIYEGSYKLSNEELLAIIFKTGNRNMSSKELASLLLSKVNGIKGLKNISYNSLVSIKGIGKMKATTLLASIELGKRINSSITYLNEIKITDASLVYEYFRDKLKDKKQEYFYCVYLDNAKKVIMDKLLFIGTINYSIVHPREVFKEAYLLSASSIICCHNHPSNNIKPSREDIELTKRLVEIGNLLGIKVLDHIIVGDNNYYSFLENEDI